MINCLISQGFQSDSIGLGGPGSPGGPSGPGDPGGLDDPGGPVGSGGLYGPCGPYGPGDQASQVVQVVCWSGG